VVIKLATSVLAAEADPTDMSNLVSPLLQYGVLGLLVIFIVVGILVPKYVMTNLMSEKDRWREAFEKEREAHQLTREQLAKAEERGDVAVEQGKTLTRLLEELGHRPELNRTA
jgi:hypothetical protein